MYKIDSRTEYKLERYSDTDNESILNFFKNVETFQIVTYKDSDSDTRIVFHPVKFVEGTDYCKCLTTSPVKDIWLADFGVIEFETNNTFYAITPVIKKKTVNTQVKIISSYEEADLESKINSFCIGKRIKSINISTAQKTDTNGYGSIDNYIVYTACIIYHDVN